ncbi:unnamed protein product [Calypogeia fissa]
MLKGEGESFYVKTGWIKRLNGGSGRDQSSRWYFSDSIRVSQEEAEWGMEHFNGERELDRVCSVFCYWGTRSGSATGISLCLCLCFACCGKLLGLLCGGTLAEHFRQGP